MKRRGRSIVIRAHVSEFPQPIAFEAGAPLDVQPGQSVIVHRSLNGWAWCERAQPPGFGWVPLPCIGPAHEEQAGS